VIRDHDAINPLASATLDKAARREEAIRGGARMAVELNA
jgi:hypothetical protein